MEKWKCLIYRNLVISFKKLSYDLMKRSNEQCCCNLNKDNIRFKIFFIFCNILILLKFIIFIMNFLTYYKTLIEY